jgi:predicted GIY-YIG superfamily endonuclease
MLGRYWYITSLKHVGRVLVHYSEEARQAQRDEREFKRKLKQEKERLRKETKHPGGRFRRQQAAYTHQHPTGTNTTAGEDI